MCDCRCVWSEGLGAATMNRECLSTEPLVFGTDKGAGSVRSVVSSGAFELLITLAGDVENDSVTSCLVGSGAVTGNVSFRVAEVVDA